MTKNNLTYEPTNFLLYTGKEGEVRVEVFLQDETLWLTQKAIGQLFGKERSVITKHLKNIFDSGELDEVSNVQKMHIPLSDKPVKFYNLDIIISVGYRVNSYQATRFRIWATKTLKEFFATVQNKLHWAITGKTAAEIIYSSVDAEKLYMGLTSIKK